MKQDVREFIESQYAVTEKLHVSDKSTITLVRNRQTDEILVLKRLKGNRDVYVKMKELSHKLLPKIIYAIVDSEETVIIEEYLNGKSVGTEPLQEDDLLHIMIQLCDVLSFLHKNGIIHRDIKPSNILLLEDKTIRLIDFDAARTEKNDSGHDTELLGTRGYAAPEQYGFAQTSPRSDIYALGITMGKLLNQAAIKHPKYEKIIAKCTDLNPNKRYKTVHEVAKAISAASKRHVRSRLAVISLSVVLISAMAIVYINFFVRPATPESNTLASITPPTAFPMQKTVKMEDVLFYSDKMNYIFLYGKSISIEGKTAEMSVDLNGDGTKERFKISRDHPNGTQFMGYSVKGGMNFFYDEWVKEILGAFDGYGEFAEHFYAQISCCDLDNDGLKEVLVSVGDKAAEQITAIYSFTGSEDASFEYKGYMLASDYIVLTSEFELIGPVGSAGLANIYKYSKGTLTQTQEG